MPQHWRLLDHAFDLARKHHCRGDQPAARRLRSQVIIEHQFAIGPVEFVGLVADGEIEMAESALDCTTKQFVQVCASGSEAGDLAAMVARQNKIVAAAELQPDIGRGDCLPDIEDSRPPMQNPVVKIERGAESNARRCATAAWISPWRSSQRACSTCGP